MFCLPLLLVNGDAHVKGGTGNDLLSRLDIVGVEIWHLVVSDLFKLSLGDVTDNLLWVARAFGEAGSLKD